jgi:hypothetical protein
VDLKGYFDSIPHEQLLACVRMRVVDRSVLHLIRLWLEAPVMENEGGSGKGGTKVSRSEKGTPQGGVVSPLLANLYLHWFDVMFHRQGGPAVRFGARLVRYADDFVVLARRAETEMPQPPAFSHPRAAGPNRAARASKRFSQNRKPRRVTELRWHRSTRFFIRVNRRSSAASLCFLLCRARRKPHIRRR